MHARNIHRLGTAAAILTLVLSAAAALPARALDHGTFSMEVLVGGVPLTEYGARARTYVEAIENREYSIRLTNRTGRRVAVALSVDGLNTIDAKTTSARRAAKWILAPWQTITLDGWQVGADSARRFFFTTEEKSYGAWLGKTSNLGIISAAVFRERRPDPVPIYRYGLEKEERQSPAAAGESAERGKASEPSASGKTQRAPQAAADSATARRESVMAPQPTNDLAATGIGKKYTHRVHKVQFEAEPGSPTVLEIRYEYRDALIRLGALPYRHYWEDAIERREHAEGFLDSEFAPDPYD